MITTYEVAKERMERLQREAELGRLAAEARGARIRQWHWPRPKRKVAGRPAQAR